MTYSIYQDLEKQQKTFEDYKKSYNTALLFFENSLKETVPETWDVTFDITHSYFRLLLIHYNHYEDKMEDAPLISFHNIVKKLEELGFVVKKDTCMFTKDHVFLDATTNYNKEDILFEIHVRQCQVDKCEIEYVEEVTVKAKLSGFCAEVLK